MAKKKKSNISIKDILKGKFLVEDGSFTHWRFLFFLVGLAFISISSSHWADRKVIEIKKLQIKVSELKSEYSDNHKILKQYQMESHVKSEVAKDNIIVPDKQPYKIVYYRE